MLKFYNILDKDSVEYLEALEVYKAGTADNLQMPVEIIEKKINSGKAVIILGKQNVMPVFMALLWKLEDTDFYINEIISIIPSAKHLPFGRIYLEVLKASEYLKTNHVLFEVEDPDFGNREENQKKLEFYLKQGLSLIEGVKTIVPSPLSGQSVNTLLCVLSDSRFLKISQNEIRSIIVRIYSDLYQHEADSYIVKTMLENVPEDIRLLGFLKF